MSFPIHYSKNLNKNIRKHLEANKELNVTKVQNYNPIYDKFFNLNEKNCNLINLNHKYQINSLDSNIDYNNYKATLIDIDNSSNLIEKDIFLKFSPLIDSTKYLLGKITDEASIFNLPKKDNVKYYPKYLDCNNLSYIDSFFTYLTSKLLYEHKFVHGLDFYGSFLCIKNNFNVDVGDEIELLEESDYFNNNINVLFDISDEYYEYSSNDSRKYKKNIKIGSSLTNLDFEVLDIQDTNVTEINTNTEENENTLLFDNIMKNKLKNNKSTNSNTSSDCSSRSSNTDNENEDEEDDER